MPNNPVQIVLNSRDYQSVPEKFAGGSQKDFFAGQDAEFVAHKQKLQQQLASVTDNFQQSAVTSGIVRVTLRREAIAKSHRPNDVLFPMDKRPCIGSADIGELFYFLDSKDLSEISVEINKAENTTRWKKDKKTQKLKPAPSVRRSEVGAIQHIDVPSISEKRHFSAEQGAAWLDDSRTGGMYLVEVFAPAGPILIDYLETIRNGIIDSAASVGLTVETFPVRLKTSHRARVSRLLGVRLAHGSISSSAAIHQKLLTVLESRNYVKRILLPPILTAASTNLLVQSAAGAVTLPVRKAGLKYPKVGVIDGGISNYYASWIIGEHSPIAPDHQDTTHADFISGLLVAGQTLNGESVCPEADGCDLYNIALLPGKHASHLHSSYYPKGIVDFMQELSAAIEIAVREQDVRVFNMSLNMEVPVAPDLYSPLAELLDEIADEHDVLFLVSAGNLKQIDWRHDWPADPASALQRLAARSASDTIFQPAESVRCLSVGALNPPGCHDPHVAGAPTCYTRRGPGLRVGIKPDFAHHGGARPNVGKETGLTSANKNGSLVQDLGTSYATPLVSKTAASLDAKIQGKLSRDTVAAMLVHLASIPSALNHESLREVARQFVGFGIPAESIEMLQTPDHEITLVFSDVMVVGHELKFDFAWPQKLVGQGGVCKGKVRMTLAYRPKLDARFGSEFVRVNLDAHLRQENGNGWKGRIAQKLLPGEANTEAELIRHGLKWWPLKIYEGEFPRGVGKSSNWRLSVESIVRSGDTFPVEGVPFTVVLTIADPSGDEPIFSTMRSYLKSHNVQIQDIRTAVQVRTRT